MQASEVVAEEYIHVIKRMTEETIKSFCVVKTYVHAKNDDTVNSVEFEMKLEDVIKLLKFCHVLNESKANQNVANICWYAADFSNKCIGLNNIY